MKSVAAMAACAALAIAEVWAVGPSNVVKQKLPLTPEQVAAKRAAARAAMMKRNGGLIERQGSRKGLVAFIDTQSRLAETNIAFVVDSLSAKTRFNMRYMKAKKGDPAGLKASSGADVAIVICEDENAPAMLYAPEERYIVVNTAKLDGNLKTDSAKTKFYDSRGRKQLLRAFAFVCGGFLSQFPGNVMEAKNIDDLDVCAESLPADTLGKNRTYLKAIGVEPAQMSTYRHACREGWAPAPTNEFQKAIWEQVKADKERGPTNPIKIKPPNAK